MRLILPVLMGLALASPALGQTPEAERTIMATVVAEHDRHIDLLERMVNVNSGTLNNVLLIGHLDTVFEPDSPFQTFVRDGSRATGPGVGDDKGGVVVIIAALRAMQAAGTLEGSNVTVVLTGDEERPGAPLEIARRDLIARLCDVHHLASGERGAGGGPSRGGRGAGDRGRRGVRHDRKAKFVQLDPHHGRTDRAFERGVRREPGLRRHL